MAARHHHHRDVAAGGLGDRRLPRTCDHDVCSGQLRPRIITPFRVRAANLHPLRRPQLEDGLANRPPEPVIPARTRAVQVDYPGTTTRSTRAGPELEPGDPTDLPHRGRPHPPRSRETTPAARARSRSRRSGTAGHAARPGAPPAGRCSPPGFRSDALPATSPVNCPPRRCAGGSSPPRTGRRDGSGGQDTRRSLPREAATLRRPGGARPAGRVAAGSRRAARRRGGSPPRPARGAPPPPAAPCAGGCVYGRRRRSRLAAPSRCSPVRFRGSDPRAAPASIAWP